MKKYITKTKTTQRLSVWRTLGLIAFLSVLSIQSANAQYTAIPDQNFEQALIDYAIDDMYDGQVLTANISNLTELFASGYNIQSLAGIEDFTSLQYLYCSSNQLTSLNINGLTNLVHIECFLNQLTSLNLNGLTNLEYLDCYQNQLTALDLTGLTNIQHLMCTDNQISALNVNTLTNLQYFSFQNNQLTSIDLSGLNNLIYLNCDGNQLTSLNLTGLINLQDFRCYSNLLTAINVSGLNNLRVFYCHNNQLTTLDVSNLPNLRDLICERNFITSINLTGLPNLQYLNCSTNLLPTLNVSGLNNLISLECSFNQISTLDLTSLSSIQFAHCQNNQLTSINVNGLTTLIQLNVRNNQLPTINVTSLTSLFTLWTNNNQLTTLNTSGLTNLRYVVCNNNQINSINLSGLTTLMELTCHNNQLTSLNLSGFVNLYNLRCNSNSSLTCIQVNNVAAANANSSWIKDASASYALSCGLIIPTTTIRANQCGITLAALNTKIGTIPVYGATGYRFEITTGGVTTIYDSYSYNFRLSDAGVAAYGTTYTIRVAALINGVYGNYGAPCTVTTPTLTSNVVPTTALLSTVCNTTLAALNTKIGATTVFGATGYRFEITTGGVTTIYDSIGYNFRLSDAGVAAYGTTYTIRVAALINGVYGNYGAPCTVTTPTLTSNVVPITSLQPAFCGTTLVALAVKIGTIPVNGATGYRFEITTGGVTTIYDSATYNFTLIQAGVAAYGTTYTIRVAALINGVYGNYGAPCTVTTPTLTTSVLPTTSLQPAFCGTTLAALAVKIGTIPVNGATGYRFEITTGGVTTIYDSATYNFTLIQAGVAAYGTTYTIRVAALINGVYGNYGAPCTVTTLPASTQIVSSFCGSTLNAMNSTITAYPLIGATAYRFEVVYGVSVRTYVSNTNSFNLTQLTGVTKYGIPYTIRVAAEINGSWIAYGSSCTITTPTPITEIQTSQCGITLSNLNTTIFATALPFITSYTFEVSDGVSVRTFVASTNSFNLTQLVGGANYATSYTIRVSAFYGGSWRPYGNSCTITTPIQVLRLKAKSFEVFAYPNPFETSFNLNLETPSKETVTIVVYDMMGKLLETHQVNPMELANLAIGNNFAAGIYNVIVSQEDNAKAVRLIRN